MSIQVKMMNNYILVKDFKQEEKVTKSGIIIPKSEKWNRMATVLACGECDQVKKGDVIMKNLGKGTPMILNDVEMEMIHINNIMCIVESNE